MLFYILIAAPAVAPLAVVTAFVCSGRDRVENAYFAFAMSIMPAGLVLLPALFSWSEHASDISKANAQQAVIDVQEERIESLTERLESFNYPDKPSISLDADTPWASMTKSLTDAEDKLARAKSERAIAIRSIEARRHGPMSGVVSFVGDYRPSED